MRLLLDTHVLIWFIEDERRLITSVYDQIVDPEVDVLVSIASLWEIAIKTSIGKLTLREPFETLIPRQLAAEQIDVLPISMPHLAALRTLPHHHRDPFDRLIIAQAMAEGVAVVTADHAFAAYDVAVVWA